MHKILRRLCRICRIFRILSAHNNRHQIRFANDIAIAIAIISPQPLSFLRHLRQNHVAAMAIAANPVTFRNFYLNEHLTPVSVFPFAFNFCPKTTP